MTFSQSELRQQVLDWLKDQVPAPRLAHSLRVETMAIDLVQHHAINPSDAAQAGLMHDLAKYFKPDCLLTLAREAGLAIDPVEEATPHLLHADVSAIVAQREFGGTYRLSDLRCYPGPPDSTGAPGSSPGCTDPQLVSGGQPSTR